MNVPRKRPAALAVALLTTAAIVAFAANSVLCRLALDEASLDPYAFTAIRLGSGALALTLVIAMRGSLRNLRRAGDWRGALYLLVYALPFSLAYVTLTTATGAILLFGAVQLTMVGIGCLRGERLPALGWLALLGALGGVVYLLLPGLAAPDPLGAAMMLVAGVGWGLYSLAGKKRGRPLETTAANFVRAALVVVPVVAIAAPWLRSSPTGIALAVASGTAASAGGYAIWYVALTALSATRAALVQLAVPALAALAGVALLGEMLSQRLVVSSAIILGCIALGILAGRREQDEAPTI